MEIKGKVHEISPVMNVTETFKKRELVIEFAENPAYPEFVKFEAIQDKVSLFDKCKVGEFVEVAFNLKGRAWTDKAGKTSYFNTLQVWKLTSLGADAGAPIQEEAPSFSAPNISSPSDDDDLPF
ncbi:DUF3127 domain-containing protein [Solitalea koreensis]|uniref:DUF3127 domain-containing protein n=1 Tax=Solitalea koreensis TaxID=543615 RepID=A0A521EEW5_9SPHI|nr:DUF3127 domain-containing protein [Solitalea koreensis]SMO82457.1 protein of unknown function [Solitalea koreensis]